MSKEELIYSIALFLMDFWMGVLKNCGINEVFSLTHVKSNDMKFIKYRFRFIDNKN